MSTQAGVLLDTIYDDSSFAMKSHNLKIPLKSWESALDAPAAQSIVQPQASAFVASGVARESM